MNVHVKCKEKLHFNEHRDNVTISKFKGYKTILILT